LKITQIMKAALRSTAVGKNLDDREFKEFTNASLRHKPANHASAEKRKKREEEKRLREMVEDQIALEA